MKLYKFHGAGNDFLIADARHDAVNLSQEEIVHLCDRHTGFGSDGLMVIGNSNDTAFKMKFYNPDGTSGMMCGNGGRCISAYAAMTSDKAGERHFVFEAPDGLHESWIESGPETDSMGDCTRVVRLKMSDVKEFKKYDDTSYFFNTGARHFVTAVDDVAHTNVYANGRAYRYFDTRFAPEGVNVDFVQVDGGVLHVRTYEKGVEDETLACGTGIVATALAAYMMGVQPESMENGVVRYAVQARISLLHVEFEPEKKANGNITFNNIYLTGPATYVGEIEVDL